MRPVVVVGAGVGGLTAGAVLARLGWPVVVLEGHSEPGGCASTFYRRGFRFDAGATVAAGFAPGQPLEVLGRFLGLSWHAHHEPLAMQVHLPDGTVINRWTDRRRWREERRALFGERGEAFWRWQERTAAWLQVFASHRPPWPLEGPKDAIRLGQALGAAWGKGLSPRWLLEALRDAGRPVAHRLPLGDSRLHLLVEGQVWISAQAPAGQANALYSAAALDLPHMGVAWLPGGIGTIAHQLARTVVRLGGAVYYRQEVVRVRPLEEGGFGVQVRGGRSWEAEAVIFNMPPGSALQRIEGVPVRAAGPTSLVPPDGWGAFTVYAAVRDTAIPDDVPLHHQVLLGEPLGEGNSIFLSISPRGDLTRSPQGFRAITISTHTALAPWWVLFHTDRAAYAARKAEYISRLLEGGTLVFPRLKEGVVWVEAGTPVTFWRFTRRPLGWVGGFPQTRIGRFAPSRLGEGLYLVGDAIFPGQSLPAVVLGAWRVAEEVAVWLATRSVRRRSHVVAEVHRCLPANQEAIPND